MYFVQENDKLGKIEKLIKKVVVDDNKIKLPINLEEKLIANDKIAEKISKKTANIIKLSRTRKVVISNDLKKYEKYINSLNNISNMQNLKLEIFDGRKIFKILSLDIVKYICEKNKLDLGNLKISILVNNLDMYLVDILKDLLGSCKKINVVTNNIERYKYLEEYFLSEFGIMISVGNNKKKGLVRSNIILNMDFPSELINKYNIKEDANIINFKGNVKIDKKRFNGINVNDIDIGFNKFEEIDDDIFYSKRFKKIEIYEAYKFIEEKYEKIKEKIKKDNVKITYLQGNNIKL